MEDHPDEEITSLCSGTGGADLAAEWIGAIEIVGQLENDAFRVQVSEQHWPHVKRMGDIREIRGDEFGDIDIAVAGFPCQPNWGLVINEKAVSPYTRITYRVLTVI